MSSVRTLPFCKVPPTRVKRSLETCPETARTRINGLPFVLRHWSALAWERTPVAERPSVTFADDRGGRFALEPAPG